MQSDWQDREKALLRYTKQQSKAEAQEIVIPIPAEGDG
jgi:hypothetical protein